MCCACGGGSTGGGDDGSADADGTDPLGACTFPDGTCHDGATHGECSGFDGGTWSDESCPDADADGSWDADAHADADAADDGGEECMDTDDGATDSFGDDCAAYVGMHDWCGSSDTSEFDSMSMCCACDGGTTGDSGDDDGYVEVDTDDDGLSDSDEAEWGTDPFNPDTDGDMLPDGEEVMAHGTDPLDPDTDHDGLMDSDELMFGTDPLIPDTDGDGLSDGEEVMLYGTDPMDPDSDHDGVSDGDEVAAGADPMLPGDYEPEPEPEPLTIADLSEGDLVITEIMYNPSTTVGPDGDNEWIELWNNSDNPIDIGGLMIRDDDAHEAFVPPGIVVEAGAVVVLGAGDGSGWGYGFEPAAFYGSCSFNNSGGDVISVYAGELQIDKAHNYDELGLDAGQSFTLQEGVDGVGNDNIENWCGASTTFDTTGDLGSPGELVGCP
jgi:hypothetical protein